MFKTCKKPPMSIISASGDICSFKALQAGIPLKSCVSQISGYQEGSGTPSPDNVRPLHAFSSATLADTGVNLWGGSLMLQSFIKMNLGGVFTYDSEKLTFTSNQMSGYKTIFTHPFKDSTRYTIYITGYKSSGSGRATNISILYADGSRNNIDFSTEPYSNKQTAIFTTQDGKTIKAITGQNGSGQSTLYYNECGIIEGVHTLDEFVAFRNTHLFTFGQSIYQGYIDWKRGVVVGTHSIVDLGSLNWARNTQYINPIFLANIPEAKVAIDSGFKPNAICSQYEVLAPNRTNVAGVNYVMTIDYYYNSSYNTTIIDTDYTDPTAFKTAMNGVYLAYELATPIEIQLSGIQIENILGENNIFADCGSTSIEAIKIGR